MSRARAVLRVHGRRLAIVALLFAQAGCYEMWESVRENERRLAADRARTLVSRGDCVGALVSLDRSQAAAELGRFAAESTALRARCLERLQRRESALAHWRLIADFYPESGAASVPPSRRAELGARWRERAAPSPTGFEIPRAHYSSSAERSGLQGVVYLEFELNQKGRAESIRVIEMEHPLLASWAIEAVAAGRWTRGEHPSPLPLRGAVKLNFVPRKVFDEGLPEEP